MKRRRDSHDETVLGEPVSKRSRANGLNHFLNLSDELVLRTLSYLPTHELVKVERVSRRLRRLASDSEIWKEKFYHKFVRPRARKVPGATNPSGERDSRALYYASKSAKWLQHSADFKDGTNSDWKRRYKVKLNWTKGRCKAQEVALDCPYQPRILVKVFRGNIYTADEKKMRIYSSRSRPHVLTTHYWDGGKSPTSISVAAGGHNQTILCIGFSDGTIQLLQRTDNSPFESILQYSLKEGYAMTSLAFSWPYILTMSADHRMTLVEIVNSDISSSDLTVQILTSLQSDALLLPVSLSLRLTPDTLIASIAYSFSRLNAGWCLGLQEIRLNLSGDIVGSRLTTTVETPMRDFPFRRHTLSSRSTSTAPFAIHPNLMSPPTSLSHSGCYILAGLPDNTLMVYTVVSNNDKLEISAGRRLFGHTSSVSGAEVSDRGKALSISAKGDEIRVWELEDLLSSWSLRKASTQLQPHYSTNILSPALSNRGSGLGLALKEMKDDLAGNRHWVGFDDEQVVVLGERHERQVLSCYDFS